MRNIKIPEISKEVKKLLIEASFNLPQDIITAIKKARRTEKNLVARNILSIILENAEMSSKQKLPLCQDCGNVYIDLTIGPDVLLPAGQSLCPSSDENNSHYLVQSLNAIVAEVYQDYYLRKSIVFDPLFERANTYNNTPAIINLSLSPEKGLGVEVNLKGGGSENCSWLLMFNPSAGKKDIVKKVIELVKKNITKACPPVIIGLGIGSTASEVVKLARKAAFRPLNIRCGEANYALLEREILELTNMTGIGPQGLGGSTTALACNIEYAACHMATMPVAITFGCHSTRRAFSRI